MPRLQILWLPPVSDDTQRPFALVVDRVEPRANVLGDDPHPYVEAWRTFAREVGALSVMVTPDTIEVDPDASDDGILTVAFDATSLGESVAAAMRSHLEQSATAAVQRWLEQWKAENHRQVLDAVGEAMNRRPNGGPL